MDNRAPIMVVENLLKRFGTFVAVNDVSFAIARGQCFGLLGPNGAGKTTTIEMMEGIKAHDEGIVLYKGEPLGSQFRREAGIMFQTTALQEFITVREILLQYSRFYSVTTALETLAENHSLGDFLHRDTRRLSGGQKQRLLLAIALINRPEVLFLDEPTTGLDPQSRHNLWDRIRQLKRDGTSILLTTHYMEEAYELCDEIAIMDHGKIIAQGAPDILLARYFDKVVMELPAAVLDSPAAIVGKVLLHDDNAEIVTSDVGGTISSLLANRIPLDHLRIRARNLEDLFLELTGKGLRP